MRYLADKLLVCALCVTLLMQGETSGASVVALLATVIAGAAFEVLPRGIRPWIPPAVCLALAAAPAHAACSLPLAAYDLARVAFDADRSNTDRPATDRPDTRWPGAGQPSAGQPSAHMPIPRWQRILVCAAAFALPLFAAALSPESAHDLATAPAYSTGFVTAVIARLFVIALPCALAGLLACRTAGALHHGEELLRLRDDLQETVLRLRGKNRELVDAQARAEHAATLAERARISREMHDSVGHLLTRSVLQVEALRVIHAAEPVEAELAQVKGTLSDALDTVRACVHNLHDESVDLQTKLAGIAGAYPCGVARLQYAAENPAPGAVADCLCALTREALSNAARHGRAARVDVTVTEYPGLWQFVAVDDGGGDKASGPGDAAGGAEGNATGRGAHAGAGVSDGPGVSNGLGLRSMREQVEALGGTFRAGPRPDHGFSVFASIPKRKATP